MPEVVEFEDEAPASSEPGTLGDVAKAVPRGAAKGTLGMISAAGMSDPQSNMEMQATDTFPPSPEQMREMLEKVTGPWGEAKTMPGRVAESVGEMLPTSLTGGGEFGPLRALGGALAGGIGSGVGKELLGTPGQIAGGVLGGAIGGAAGVPKTPRPDFEETFNLFHRLGLTPTAATTGVGGKTTQWLEANAFPQAIGSANRMQKVVEGNLQKLTDQQQDIASKFGAPARRKADAGEDLRKTVLSGWQDRREEAGKIFNAIGKAFGPTDRFYPRNLFDAVYDPIGGASTKIVKKATDDPEIRDLKQILKKTNNALSYSDLTALKSKYGRMLEPGYDRTVNDAQIGQIVRALDNDIEDSVKSLGNKDVLRDWQYAKATYDDALTDYRQSFKKLLGTKDMPVNGEKVYDTLVNQWGGIKHGDREAFKKVWGQLGKEKQGELSATVLSHMGNKDPEKLGDLEGFSLSTFLTNYKNLSPDAKELMFKNTGNVALQQSYEDLVTAAQKMGVWNQLASSSRSGTVGSMMAQVAAPAVFLATGKVADAAKSLVLNIGGPAAASVILTDPKWVKRLAYAMDKVNGGLEGSTKAMLGVMNQLQAEDIDRIPGGSGNQIPQFAQGGIVTQPTVAMVGEKGPEAIVPLGKKLGALGQGIGGILPGLESAIGGARQKEMSVLSGLESKLGGMEGGFMGWLEGLLSRTPQGRQLEARLKGSGIPGFAEGGVVTEPTVAVLGERGPEAVIPLSESGMAQQAAEAAASRVRAPYAQHAPSGLLDIGQYYGDKLMSALTAPRDALTGALQVTDPATGMPTPQAMARSQSVANMAMTGSIPFAQRGAAGMAGGKLGGSASKPQLKTSGTMAGVKFDVTPEQYDKLLAARKAGAEREEIQKLVDSFKGGKELSMNISADSVIAAALRAPQRTTTLGKAHVNLSDLRKQFPGVSKEEFDRVVTQAQRDGKLILYREDNQSQLTDAEREAAIYIGNEPRHMVVVE